MTALPEAELAFVRDLVMLLKADALAAKEASAVGDPFEKGRQMAYFEVLDLIVSQAKAFQIDLAAIALDDFDPMRDVLINEQR